MFFLLTTDNGWEQLCGPQEIKCTSSPVGGTSLLSLPRGLETNRQLPSVRGRRARSMFSMDLIFIFCTFIEL